MPNVFCLPVAIRSSDMTTMKRGPVVNFECPYPVFGLSRAVLINRLRYAQEGVVPMF